MKKHTFITINLFIALLSFHSCEKEEIAIIDSPASIESIRCSDFEPINYGATIDTLYVDNNHSNADDSNIGSDINNPLKTIAKAFDNISAGTMVFIRQGVYNEGTLVISKSGSLKNPIFISAYPASSGYEEVVIDGAGQSGETIGILFDQGIGNIKISGLIIKNMSYAGIASNDEPLSAYENITLTDLLIETTGTSTYPGSGYGIILYAPKNFRIQNIESRNNNLDGISVWGIEETLLAENGLISDCHAHHNDDGVDGWEADAHGIAINQGQNIAVCNCQANDNSDHGFDASDYPKAGKISTNITFENNISFNNQNIGFSANSDSRNILYYRNIAYGNNWGFGFYEGVGKIECFHNVALQNRYGLYLDGDYANYVDPGNNALYFVNNIFCNNELNDLYQNGEGYELSLSHNNFFNSSNGTIARVDGVNYEPSNIDELGSHNLNLPPMFINEHPDALDLNLDDGSMLIDAGEIISINGSTLGFIGMNPDIGAHERQ